MTATHFVGSTVGLGAGPTGETQAFAVLAAELLARQGDCGKARNTIGRREWLYGLAGDSSGKHPVVGMPLNEMLAAQHAV